MQDGIPWDVRESNAQIHYRSGLWLDIVLDQDAVWDANCTMGIENAVEETKHHCRNHCLVVNAIMVNVQCSAKETPQPELHDELGEIIQDIEKCGLLGKWLNETIWSTPLHRIDFSHEPDKKAPY